MRSLIKRSTHPELNAFAVPSRPELQDATCWARLDDVAAVTPLYHYTTIIPLLEFRDEQKVLTICTTQSSALTFLFRVALSNTGFQVGTWKPVLSAGPILSLYIISFVKLYFIEKNIIYLLISYESFLVQLTMLLLL